MNRQSVDSIRCKFFALYNHKKPTKVPYCSPQANHAKRVWKMLQSEMIFLNGEKTINDPLNDSEEDIAMEGDDDEENRASEK